LGSFRVKNNNIGGIIMAANKVYIYDLDEVPVERLEGGGEVRRIVTKEKTGVDLTFSKGFAPPGCGHDMHCHEDKDEVIFCLEGGGTMTVEGHGDIEYRPGMTIVIPRGIKHCNKNTTDKELHVVTMFNPALR
jgi:oxalate decarboxylase/phosphoglucose isomerase-like protein (cupin superfamily)